MFHFHLPWFGSHMALRGGALAHHCRHANLKVFGDVLYVGLCEAHPACQHEAEKEKCDEEKLASMLLTLDCGVQGLQGLWCCTCGCVRLGYGVYSVHVYRGLVLLLPLQGEHHLSQGVGDPPPLQNHTWQRVQRAQLLQNILPTPFGQFSHRPIMGRVDT